MEQVIDNFSESLKRAAKSVSVELPAASIPIFRHYMDELQRWNRAVNLTSIQDQNGIIAKHFVDSLAALRVIETHKDFRVLDVGSGAGFPGLPLKLVRPDLSVCLLEPNEKKSAFLRYMIGRFRIEGAEVITRKLEDYAALPVVQGVFDCIVVRAYSVLGAGDILRGLLADSGKLILYRSSKIEKDFRLSGLALLNELEYELPSGYGHRVLSSFSKQIT